MMRRGMLCSGTALLLAAAAMTYLTLVAAAASGRANALAARQERIQGREWCMGASALRSGAALIIGHWRIERHLDGSTSASGPAGAFSIDAHSHERWDTHAGSRR